MRRASVSPFRLVSTASTTFRSSFVLRTEIAFPAPGDSAFPTPPAGHSAQRGGVE